MVVPVQDAAGRKTCPVCRNTGRIQPSPRPTLPTGAKGVAPAPRPSVAVKAPARPQRKALWLLLAGVALLGLIGAGAAWLWLASSSGAPAATAAPAFLATGEGLIARSVDGRLWDVKSSAILSGIATGAGLNVVVGGGGTILTSTDLRSWTTQTSGTSVYLTAITYGSGRFVAVGWNGTILSSKDGRTWSLEATKPLAEFYSIAYGAGAFVAAGYQEWMRSTDGEHWTDIPAACDLIQHVWFVGGFFLGTGRDAATSVDGINWTCKHNDEIGTGFTTVEGNVVGFGFANDLVKVSSDLSVQSTPMGPHRDVRVLAYHDGLYVGLGTEGNVSWSRDGKAWTASSALGPEEFTALTWSSGSFVALGQGSRIATSSDGQAWQIRSVGTDLTIYGVAYGKGQFVAVGANAKEVEAMTSSDGVTWVHHSLPLQHVPTRLVFADGKFVAGTFDGSVLVSVDGVSWASHSTGATAALFGIGFFDGRFYAVGEGGAIVSSADAGVWSMAKGAGTEEYDGIAWLPGQFVAVGPKQVAVSTDGSLWTTQKSPGALADVTAGNGTFVAVGESGLTYKSKDGVTWTIPRMSPYFLDLQAVRFVKDRFVLVGSLGAVATSPDGLKWTAVGHPTSKGLWAIANA